MIMTLARGGVHILRTILGFIFFTLFSLQSVQANRWDSQSAARAFEEACQRQSRLEQATQPDLRQYLECAKTYRRVYLLDPHYEHAADAIHEEGIIYQSMADKSADPEHFRIAAKRFQFLVKDYGGSRHCPDALVRLVTIYSENLRDKDAAQQAYQLLETRYKRARREIELAREEISRESAPSQAASPAPSVEKTLTTSTASVQNIRCWSTTEYTRVIVDLDADAPYTKNRLSNPDRIYFDISNAKVADNYLNRAIEVGDEFLKQVRVGQNLPNVVRVVLDIVKKNNYTVSELHDPFRIVIDFQHQSAAKTKLRPLPQALNSTSGEAGQGALLRQSAPVNQDVKTLPPGPTMPAENRVDSATQVLETKRERAPMAVTQIESTPLKELKPAPTGDPKGVTKIQNSAVEISADSKIKPVGTPPSKSEAVSKIVESSDAKLPATVKPDLDATPKAAAPTSLGDQTLTRMLGLKVGRIIIDPGHGGHDWGTVGPGGLLEKDLVLSLARHLKKLIETNLYGEVILTRNDDSFVSLEERTAIANRYRADLFISIHANYSRHRSISGAETYYLDFADTASEREVAARENASAFSNVSDLENMIKKIAQADKSAESRELASILQKSLYSGTRKLFPSGKNRGVRKAPFVVLIGANMPSVLAEVAFLSNPKDERALNKEANQEAMAKALFSGIKSYINTLGSNMAQNQRSPK
jgi:N-acetylmuramoyl-L-alanine amidase